MTPSGPRPGSVTSAGSRHPLESDHHFDQFASPVSNPFYFLDPRALTEIRPIFIWQKTPNSNPIFNGNSNFFLGLQARVAVTERIDVVMNEIGGIWQNPRNQTPYFQKASGMSELRIGPKFTFLRDETDGTVGAFGITFDIPSGSGRVEQDTGVSGWEEEGHDGHRPKKECAVPHPPARQGRRKYSPLQLPSSSERAVVDLP